MKNKLVISKNIFCILTVTWSSIMLVEYIFVLLPFQINCVLFGIFDSLIILLYLGIWCVPVLCTVSIVLMAWVREKHKDYTMFKVLNIVTIVMPIILAVLMLLTDFNARLQ